MPAALGRPRRAHGPVAFAKLRPATAAIEEASVPAPEDSTAVEAVADDVPAKELVHRGWFVLLLTSGAIAMVATAYLLSVTSLISPSLPTKGTAVVTKASSPQWPVGLVPPLPAVDLAPPPSPSCPLAPPPSPVSPLAQPLSSPTQRQSPHSQPSALRTQPSAPASQPSVPSTLPPVPPSQPSHTGGPSFIGGCRAYWPRADYLAKIGCTNTTPCELCGGSTCHEASPTSPSGMAFPRLNVPQFAGNAVWDGHVLDAAGAIGAMLGDPFQFGVTPELDALRRLLMGDPFEERMQQLQRRWRLDKRYCMWAASTITRDTFLLGMRGLTAERLLTHPSWEALLPESARRRVEAALANLSHLGAQEAPHASAAAAGWNVYEATNCYGRFGSTADLGHRVVVDTAACRAWCLATLGCEAIVVEAQRTDQCYLRGAVRLASCRNQPRFDLHVVVRLPRGPLPPALPPPPPMPRLGLEAATCAAVALMDGLFSQRTADDVWTTALEAGRKQETDPHTLFNALYRRSSTFTERRQEDPHGALYATPYQWNANGFYGGDVTLVFAPSAVHSTSQGEVAEQPAPPDPLGLEPRTSAVDDIAVPSVDLKWLLSRQCSGPSEPGQTQRERDQAWCARREVSRFAERPDPDSGELLTPNYKAPREVSGVMTLDWLPCPADCMRTCLLLPASRRTASPRACLAAYELAAI